MFQYFIIIQGGYFNFSVLLNGGVVILFFRTSAQRWEGWPFRAQRKFECKAIFRTRSAKIFLAYGHYILFHVYEWLEDNIPQHEDEKLLEDYQMGCF